MAGRWWRWWCLGLLGSLGPVWGADQDRARYERPLKLPAVTVPTLVRVEFDSHLYQHACLGFADLQLWDTQTNYSVPLRIDTQRVDQLQEVEQQFAPEAVEYKLDPQIGMVIHVSVKAEDPAPQEFVIQTRLQDFDQQVQVEEEVPSDPPGAGPSYRVVGSGLIFDYSRHFPARNLSVSIGKTTARRFRLTIANVSATQELGLQQLRRELADGRELSRTETSTIHQRPFAVAGIELRSKSMELDRGVTPLKHEFPVVKWSMVQDVDQKVSHLRLPTNGRPISEVELTIESQNYSREWNANWVWGQGDSANRQPAGAGRLMQFAVGTLQKRENKLELKLPTGPGDPAVDQRFPEELEITLRNGDNPPLKVAGVKRFGPLHEVLVLAAQGQSLKLTYGAPVENPPTLDTAALDQAIASLQPTELATLSEPISTTMPLAASPPRAQWWKSPILWGLVIASLTLILGYTLYQAAQQISPEATPPNEPTTPT
jgi:hypothetical protein